MAQKLDIELTAKQSESTWSWRAAGAKLPKGSLSANVLYDGAKVGDVVRADAEVGIDGIEIRSVAPPFQRSEKPVERIEVKGGKRFSEGVTTSLVKKRGKGKGDRPQRRRDGERSDRGDRGGQRGDRGQRRDGRDRGDRNQRGDRNDRTPRGPRTPRIMPKMKYRGAILDTLEPQQRRIAELLLKGGMQAVRRALEEDVRNAADAGQTTIDISPLMTAAEDLWPTLKTADWMDKAEATQEIISEVSLRDLRTIVSTGEANARNDESRALLTQLREALEKRTEEDKTKWLDEIETGIKEGRIIRALKVSSRPPDPSIKFPAELANQLTEAANAALAPDVEVDRWLSVLEAVTVSPVRRAVVPAGLPADKDDPRLEPAKSAAGKVPSLTKLFGITMPPPPVARIAPAPKKCPPRPKKAAAPKAEADKVQANEDESSTTTPAPPIEAPAPAEVATESSITESTPESAATTTTESDEVTTQSSE